MTDWAEAHRQVRDVAHLGSVVDGAFGCGALVLGGGGAGAIALLGPHHDAAGPALFLLAAVVMAAVSARRAWLGRRGAPLLLDATVLEKTVRARGPRRRGARGLSYQLLLEVREARALTPQGPGAPVPARQGRHTFRAEGPVFENCRVGERRSLVLLPTGVVLCTVEALEAMPRRPPRGTHAP